MSARCSRQRAISAPARADRQRRTRIVPFTGAGISTECGIPDFRSPGGIWTKISRSLSTISSPARRCATKHWRRRFAMEEHFARRRPAAAISRSPRSTRRARCPALITQNIDNLHQASGIAAERRRRAARQHDLCDLPRLRGALRARRGCAQRFDASRLRARLPAAAATSRRRPSRSARRCPKRRCGAREELDARLPICSSRSVRRCVVWPAAGFPLDGEAQRRARSSSSTASRPTSTTSPTSSCATTSAAVLAPFISH